MRNLIIIGAGGLGKEAAWTALAMNRDFSGLDRWHLLGFADDDTSLLQHRVFDVPVLGTPEKIAVEDGPLWFHCAIGDNQLRRSLAERCLRLHWRPATLIHPSVIKARDVIMGEGVYIGAGSIINPDARIGEFVLINQRVAIGHDAVLEDWSQINPGAQINGQCRVGLGAMIGSNASMHPGVTVGAHAIVGSNSQVLRNVPPNTTVNGVPAQVIYHNRQQ